MTLVAFLCCKYCGGQDGISVSETQIQGFVFNLVDWVIFEE